MHITFMLPTSTQISRAHGFVYVGNFLLDFKILDNFNVYIVITVSMNAQYRFCGLQLNFICLNLLSFLCYTSRMFNGIFHNELKWVTTPCILHVAFSWVLQMFFKWYRNALIFNFFFSQILVLNAPNIKTSVSILFQCLSNDHLIFLSFSTIKACKKS